MSIINNIIGRQPLDITKLNSFVSSIDGVKYKNRGEGTFHYWIDGKSTRGVDITPEKKRIEVRNTILSNKHDYELTNKVVQMILSLTQLGYYGIQFAG